MRIGGIVRWLESQGVSTRKGQSPWERSTVWQMLRNPAYKGTACFGKTQIVPRRKVTRRLRQRGGFSKRCSANQERGREEWIEIPVPALVTEETFALAQERLQKNKQLSIRHTQEPTLLQGMLVCRQCGYAYWCERWRGQPRHLLDQFPFSSPSYFVRLMGPGCDRSVRQILFIEPNLFP
jgi:site-specific DNA recombinase